MSTAGTLTTGGKSRKVLAAAATVPIALAAAACSTPQSQQQSTTTQTNTFMFEPFGANMTLGYTYGNSYSVSSGQPWGGVTGCGPVTSQNCTITVLAGRHQTSEVSSWFQSQGNGLGSCTRQCGGWPPSALNFAINGTLQVNGNNYQLAVGQGSQSAGSNNWWYTGNGWMYCTANTTSQGQNQNVQGLCTPDGQYLLTGVDDDSWVGVQQVSQLLSSNTN